MQIIIKKRHYALLVLMPAVVFSFGLTFTVNTHFAKALNVDTLPPSSTGPGYTPGSGQFSPLDQSSSGTGTDSGSGQGSGGIYSTGSDSGSGTGSGSDSGSGPTGSSTAGCQFSATSTDICNPLPHNDAKSFAIAMTKYLLSLVALAAVTILVIAGLRLTAGGASEDNAKNAKKMATWAIYGLVLSILAYSVIAIVTNSLKP